MNLDLTPTPTSTKSTDDTEVDDNSQDTSPLSYTNGAQKNHHQQPPLPPAPAAYKECMKNHAASIGGHAVDGCGEFMPTPSSTTNPTSLKCAACGCHRNFHRREPESPAAAITPPFLDFRHPPLPKRFSLSSSPPPPPAAVAPTPYAPHFLFSLSTGVGAEEHHQAPVTPTAENPVSRKRFRSKFSQEQKEKMLSFSEKLGWKMHKSDEAVVKDFCDEIGVTKGVLKVWMHNNKTTFGRKEIHGGGDTTKSTEERKIDNNGGHFQNYESGNGAHFHSSNNGSSSSL